MSTLFRWVFVVCLAVVGPGLHAASAEPAPPPAPVAKIVVAVNGAVVTPGRYVVEPGATVAEVLHRAGGYAQDAWRGHAVFLLLREQVVTVDEAKTREFWETRVTEPALIYVREACTAP